MQIDKLPKLSVLIKTYNHAPYIRQCIESVLTQDFNDFEVIVTDDASTDDTAKIVREYSDPRIFLEVLSENLGVSGAMNHTIARARGEFVAILNSDDYALPERFSEQLSFLESNEDIDAIFGVPLLVDESGKPLVKKWKFKRPDNYNRSTLLRHFFKHGNFICAPSGMLRRKAVIDIGPYDRRLINLNDFDMWVRFVIAGYKLSVLPKPFTAFRIRAGQKNESAGRLESRARAQLEWCEILRRYLELADFDIEEIFKKDFQNMAFSEDERAHWKLARLALEGAYPAHRLFGWQVMYELANQTAQFKMLRDSALSVNVFHSHDLSKIPKDFEYFKTRFVNFFKN